jgi:hypothetical protein
MFGHDVDYLREKLECIYGATFVITPHATPGRPQ